MQIQETTFKGKAILVISSDDGKRIFFSAGINKVNTILTYIGALNQFSIKYSPKQVPGATNAERGDIDV